MKAQKSDYSSIKENLGGWKFIPLLDKICMSNEKSRTFPFHSLDHNARFFRILIQHILGRAANFIKYLNYALLLRFSKELNLQ